MYPKNNKSFRFFLSSIFKTYSNLKEDIIENVLLNNKGLELFSTAFTHTSIDEVNNYEFLEFLGDTTLNKSIAWYLSKRFPELSCQEGVKILTRLKINLISKKSFGGLAKKLGFWEYVSCDSDTRQTKMEKVCEDVFEAFFGATEFILDDHYHMGVGYTFCYNMISSFLDMEKISLKYEDLFDTKTRLKELFDFFGASLGILKYTCEKVDRVFNVKVYRVIQKPDNIDEIDIHLSATMVGEVNTEGRLLTKTTRDFLLTNESDQGVINKLGTTHFIKKIKLTNRLHQDDILIGKGSGSLKQNAEQYAAKDALIYLKNLGFSKAIPEGYSRFCK